MNLARVGDLAEQVRGVTFAKSDASRAPADGCVPILTAGNIQDGRLVLRDLTYVPTNIVRDKQRVRRDDVVVCTSSGSLSVIGKSARSHGDFDGGFGAFLKVLRPGPDVDPGYFAHFFQTPAYRRRVASLATGANINNLKNEHLDQLEILLPPISEQHRIARILGHADALRAKRRQALAQLDVLAQSVFHDMFADIGAETELATVCTRITDGTHQSPTWEDAGIPFLFVSNITSGEIDMKTQKCVSEQTWAELTRRTPIDAGDVLYSTVGSYGIPAVVRTAERFAFQRHIAHIKPAPEHLVPDFLASQLASPRLRHQAERAARGIAQPTVNLADIKKFKVSVPPLEDQKQFAARVGAINVQRAVVHRAQQRDDELFASIQSRAFRGEL